MARGLLQLEPYHEPTQRLLLHLLAQSGRRQVAVEGFEIYRTGRQDELEASLSRLSRTDCRLVTVIAPGGMGKTRLAIEAALQMRPASPTGVCFVPLAGVLALGGTSLLEDALGVFRSKRNDGWIALALAYLGKAALAQKEYGRAQECLLEGLGVYRSIGDRWGLGLFLAAATELRRAIGTLREARELAEEARALLIEIGHMHALGEVYRVLGEISWAEGRHAEAEENYRRSIATYREIGQEVFAAKVEEERAGRRV